MSILEIKNLSHSYDGKILFKDADLSVNNGEHAGIVGLNGAGKTTFINILAGSVMQDSGEINWLNGISRAYLDQHADIDRSITVMEYLNSAKSELFKQNSRMEAMYAEMGNTADPDELEKLINKSNNILEMLTRQGFFELNTVIKKISAGLGVDKFGYDTPVAELSGGMRAKLMLTKLLLEEPDIMLLDEPTNFLDIEHISWLADFLNASEKTFLVISHDTEFLDKICRFVINIENGSIKKYSGNYSQFMQQREENAKQYSDSYNRQQREIEKLEDYIARNKARAATAGMANARKKQLDKIEVLVKPSVIYDAEFDFPCVPLHTKQIVAAKDLEIGYGSPLLPPINFEVSGEAKLWIRGTNGIGKTTLLKTLMGILPALSGSYSFHPASKTGYLEQDPEFREMEISPVAYFSDFYPRLNIKEVRASLAKVGIKNDLATKHISNLSGGEQVRIRLATLMKKETNILILDEPTNHLDVRAKDVLKAALKAYKGAMILVSHEKEFAGDICNDILDIKF